MALGKRCKAVQQQLYVATDSIRSLDNVFYRSLNGLLEEHGFDDFAEEACREVYADTRGRPGVPPVIVISVLTIEHRVMSAFWIFLTAPGEGR